MLEVYVRQNSLWSDELVERLRTGVDRGLSAKQIGIEIGMSRSSVIGKISRMGLRLSRSSYDGPQRLPKQRARRINPYRGKVNTNDAHAVFRSTISDHHIMAVVEAREISAGRLPKYKVINLPDEPYGTRVPLFELAAGMCRWPIGHVGEEGFGFCGHEQKENLPYCERHCGMAYIREPANTPRISEAERAKRRVRGKKFFAQLLAGRKT